ncbi:ribonuclease P protein subunit p29-like [Amphibalanus amphitrite]|uniref:ribonuclease P protein subunit p29-like n=1 Tax=Amphibalanus amphitrite TaxID=1232801 RepID=UPI001C90C5E7|nr:ribonuclease P protein subunit p29-like [Amphibalanus amphitrite]XP_043202804.1 ribonuclease P protein subunit p29-like [Amphibalanus amphitrite]XP_043202806.1 ribonuclease P protein subunit p29-like [Amphibalanus amphitrite]XP_043202815.1 ribonuclease P protein subunit p29-like [Amphibalanus amphitrite]
MAELVKNFINANVPSKDAKNIEEGFLTKSIVMSKRQKPKKKPQVRLRKGALTSRSRRELGFHKLDRTGLKYADYVPLNDLWHQYMRNYLDLDTLNRSEFRAEPWDTRTEQRHLQLCRADYHGARLTVLRSRCHSFVGVTGIVLLETRGTFQLITADNTVKMIPKEHSVFETRVDGFKIRLFGNNLLTRAVARGMKKMKSKKTIEL